MKVVFLTDFLVNFHIFVFLLIFSLLEALMALEIFVTIVRSTVTLTSTSWLLLAVVSLFFWLPPEEETGSDYQR
jgi:hypothetical protein